MLTQYRLVRRIRIIAINGGTVILDDRFHNFLRRADDLLRRWSMLLLQHRIGALTDEAGIVLADFPPAEALILVARVVLSATRRSVDVVVGRRRTS